MSEEFQIGEQVWVDYAGQFWPAKVIPPELGGEAGQSLAPGELLVQYYGSNEMSFVSVELLSPYDRNSPKGVTRDPAIRASIEQANMDDAIVVVRRAGTAAAHETKPASSAVTGKSQAGGGATAAAPARPRAAKRPREETATGNAPPPARKASAAPPAASSSAASRVVGYESLSDVDLLGLRDELDAAVASRDVRTVRGILVKLARTSVSWRQLRATKIGISVGEVLGAPAASFFSRLVPVAVAILRFWSGELPPATLEALSRLQAIGRSAATDAAVIGDSLVEGAAGGYPAATSDFFGAAADQSDPFAAHDGATLGPADVVVSAAVPSGADHHHHAAPAAAAHKFVDRVVALFNLPDELSAIGVSSERCHALALELDRAANTREMRSMLVDHLSKPGHGKLRASLLRGELAPARFFELRDDELLTDAERAAAEAAEVEKMRLMEESEASMMMSSDMYECPRCSAKKSKFHTMQTRGADEPETVFLHCMECNFDWTLN